MPKRSRNKCEESEYDYLAKKLKRLERKIKCRRRRHSSSSTHSDSQPPRNQLDCDTIAVVDDDSYGPEVGCSYWNDWPLNSPGRHPAAPASVPASSASAPASPEPVAGATPRAAPAPPPADAINGAASQSAAAPALPPAAAAQAPASAAPLPTAAAPLTGDPGTSITSTPSDPMLDPDLMAILGEDPTAIKEYGDDIQRDLAIRLNHVATSGLSKDNRKELKDKHLIPGNCKMIKAPTLNPEIRASLIESQAKRDKGIENKQTLNACALSSLSRAITLLMSSDNKNQELLKLLMDTARILGDIQHGDSVLRRFFILSTIKKDLKDQLEKTKIDDMLFGANLAETIKTAKTINKSGEDIRSIATAKAQTQKSFKPSTKTLNYRAPPMSRKPAPAGGRAPRPTQPAPTQRRTTTPQHNFRTSLRQQQPRHRR